MSEQDVLAAVEKSGFPLQTIIAQRLRDEFFVQEEWGFVDRDTQELRTIDILAQRRLYPREEANKSHIRPTLNLLIECKKSELPYVFFVSETNQSPEGFPSMAGLRTNSIKLTTDDDTSTWNFRIIDVLGLADDSFFSTPEFSYSFSRVTRKGSHLDLMSNDSFHSLVLPLLKAVHHFTTTEEPGPAYLYFGCHMVIPVAVIDAPMVAVSRKEENTKLELTPWVRTIRRETDDAPGSLHGTRQMAIDVVHKDFLVKYIETHVMPFATKFSTLAIKHEKVLVSGKGFASGLGRSSFGDLEHRIKPRPR